MQEKLQNNKDVNPIENETITKVKTRGRQKGETKDECYIPIFSDIRISISKDSFIIEEKSGETWLNKWFPSSWESTLDILVKRCGTEKISKKEELTFKEAQNEFVKAVKEVKGILLDGYKVAFKEANDDIKKTIKKYLE